MAALSKPISSVFPQLFLSALNMSEEQNATPWRILKRASQASAFQTVNGGFSYWPGEGYDSEWGSNYRGHFIMEAEKAGLQHPGHENKVGKYQQMQAHNWSASNQQ